MAGQRSEFGYYPRPLDLTVGPVSIATRDGLEERVKDVEKDEWREGKWIYAPLQPVTHLGGGTSIRPYPARVFGLPKTHDILHATAPDLDPVNFHVWSLSFFNGMRFTITEAGFLDSTPIEPGTLVDFVLLGGSLEKSIELAEAFWTANQASPERARIWVAAVHALFMSQNPQHLQFERFLFLYTALDACFALAKSLNPPRGRLSHSERIAWMCDWLGVGVPTWADPAAAGGVEVAAMRNPMIHEGLYMGEPLGFALHGVGQSGNLTLEMCGLVSRLLVALLGARNNRYISSSTGTRQRQGLDLG
ncbi:hypothetical protein GGR90_003063 [Sphingopyxis italica]|uniref:Apea-like HEPN domain-containing protein n=1 Tax=Sphingopyxis italica TaxID=1129133 RepID=A0A7X5XV68_9SPHN|nr:hypothetical protein [Sphingopyxis italica]NJB90861.1 hypothetical protein [Sphingopyxis italica]